GGERGWRSRLRRHTTPRGRGGVLGGQLLRPARQWSFGWGAVVRGRWSDGPPAVQHDTGDRLRGTHLRVRERGSPSHVRRYVCGRGVLLGFQRGWPVG